MLVYEYEKNFAFYFWNVAFGHNMAEAFIYEDMSLEEKSCFDLQHVKAEFCLPRHPENTGKFLNLFVENLC